MRYMVNVKFSIVSYIFLFFLISYSSYLIYDHNHQNMEYIKDFGMTKKTLAAKLDFDAVLLGGSNVAFSLSAEQLTLESNNSWFNFGLSSEGFKDKNYWSFIEETIDKDKRSKIKFAVYSSISPLKSGHISLRMNSIKNTWGEISLGLFPSVSLAHRLKSLFSIKKTIVYPTPLFRGDFNFENKECNQKYSFRFEREINEFVLQKWVESQSKVINRVFPNAKIIFVTPSEFYGNKYDEDIANLMNDIFKNIVLSNSSPEIIYFSQNPFPSQKFTCDSMLHGNFNGREWRTKELSKFLSKVLK
jgi:hypothetical protein